MIAFDLYFPIPDDVWGRGARVISPQHNTARYSVKGPDELSVLGIILK